VSKRHSHILNAAAELFAHYGYAKTTVADIARAAKIGVGTVYLEFDSKDRIVERLVDAKHEWVLESMEAAASSAADPASAITTALDARLGAYLASCEGGPHAREMLLCPCQAAHEARARYCDAERAFLARLVGEGTAQGALAPGNPERTATALQAAYSAFEPPRVYTQDVDSVRDRQRDVHELVVEGLRRR